MTHKNTKQSSGLSFVILLIVIITTVVISFIVFKNLDNIQEFFTGNIDEQSIETEEDKYVL
jgi:hypothetical protein